MSRFARSRQVYFFEEPIYDTTAVPWLDLAACLTTGVTIATPHVPAALTGSDVTSVLRSLLDSMLSRFGADRVVAWYYTPMMLPFSRHLATSAVVYDCMDELANFRFAPAELVSLERELIGRADVMFTGGYSLYEAKRWQHGNIHPFPSSVDRAHFACARAGAIPEPDDQARIPGPRLGFYGVVDERMDLDLLAAVADARPDWSIVIIGPVVKIDANSLPVRPNIHYLGPRSYAELPAYAARWDAALMPFAINDSTRFISPTKTPEYLAAGVPVVSTAITDVIRHYGDVPGVRIAADATEFVAACDDALTALDASWLQAADAKLAPMSWDRTFGRMDALVTAAVAAPADTPTRRTASRGGKRAKPYHAIVVGAGFAGSVLAERLARGANKRVLLIDRRAHIGGNAYDCLDAAGVMIHQYGPHIFHTNSDEIVNYLSRFTRWRPYEHRVLAAVRDKLVPMPINRTTLNTLFGADLRTEADAEAFYAARREPPAEILTSEDVVLAGVGRELYETFFRGYTRKQWGVDPSALDRTVTARVPARCNEDDRYFLDRFQAMPLHGYTRMFENMLDHPNITVETGVDYRDVRNEVACDTLIYSGPIDEFFDFRLGKLPYRSLEFQHSTIDREQYQPVAVVNYPDESVPYTRITEYKHLTGQVHPSTSITHEFPRAEGDPYYPIPCAANRSLYKQYEQLAAEQAGVTFVGRLGTYQYYNMDQVVGQALSIYRRLYHPTVPSEPAMLASA